MTTILLYLLLVGINIPSALNKKNPVRVFNGFAIGFNTALLLSYLIENY